MIKLFCLCVLAPVLVWKFGVGETYKLYKEKHRLEILNQDTALGKNRIELPTLSASSEPLISNGKLLQLFADSLSVRHVEVISYTPELMDAEGENKLYCGKLLLSGTYIELVRMVSIIEQAALPIKIASISFDYNEKLNSILLHLYIEQIEL